MHPYLRARPVPRASKYPTERGEEPVKLEEQKAAIEPRFKFTDADIEVYRRSLAVRELVLAQRVKKTMTKWDVGVACGLSEGMAAGLDDKTKKNRMTANVCDLKLASIPARAINSSRTPWKCPDLTRKGILA